MTSTFDIEALVADLAPVRRVRGGDAMAIAIGATLISCLAVVAQIGIRPDIVAGNPHPIAVIRMGLLLLLGFAAVAAIATAARPAVGKSHNGWMWALAAAAMFPLAAISRFVFHSVTGEPLDSFVIDFQSGPLCLMVSGASAVWIGAVTTWWLRRGAPTALNRAGWLVGIAAGSLGTFSYSLHCNSDSIFYIGFWYSLAVLICAVAGRLIVPRLIRW